MKVTVDDIIKKYKNKKGDEEAETILIDNNADKKRSNTVSIWGCTSDISKIALTNATGEFVTFCKPIISPSLGPAPKLETK